MDNLLKIGISEETINEMLENNDPAVVSDLDYNADIVKEVLDNLSFLNKETLKKLLVHYNLIFGLDEEIIRKVLTAPELKGLKDEIDTEPLLLYEIFGL